MTGFRSSYFRPNPRATRATQRRCRNLECAARWFKYSNGMAFGAVHKRSEFDGLTELFCGEASCATGNDNVEINPDSAVLMRLRERTPAKYSRCLDSLRLRLVRVSLPV